MTIDSNIDKCPNCESEKFLFFLEDEKYMQRTADSSGSLELQIARACESYAFEHGLKAAIGQFQIAIFMAPQDILAYLLLGEILIKEEKYEDAIPWLEKAIKLNICSSARVLSVGKPRRFSVGKAHRISVAKGRRFYVRRFSVRKALRKANKLLKVAYKEVK